MTPAWRHRLRRTRFVLGGMLGVAVIALAALMALTQLMLPLAARYPERVAALLSERLQRPVSFSSMDGHWQPSGPLLVLHRVRIGGDAGAPALVLPSAEVKMDFGALLWPSRHWVNLRLRGLQLQLDRDADGAWHATGFGTGAAGASPIALDRLPGNLWLSGLRLDIADAASGKHYALLADSLRLSNDGGHLGFAGLLRRPDMAQTLRVAGRFRTDARAGRIYVAGEAMDLGALLRGVDVGGYALEGGRGDLELWLEWRRARVAGGTARLDLTALAVRGPAGGVAIPALHGLFQLRQANDGTHILYADGTRGAARIDIAHAAGGERVVARVRDLDLAALVPLAALLPQLPAASAQWLAAAHPRGHVQAGGLRWARHGIEALFAQFDGLAFDAVGRRPGIDRLAGVVRGDRQAIALDLPQQATTVRFLHTFRQPFVLAALGGTVVARHADGAWHVGSNGVRVVGAGFDAEARGEVALTDAGGKPDLDIYAAIHADVPAAKQFWPDSMAPSTAQWLDGALVAGRLDGAAVLHGNLADWPFRDHRGRFEGRGVLSGLTLDYNPQWPRAEGVAAVASFVDNGMLVEATAGQSLGVQVNKAVAGIADFHDSPLTLTVQGAGSGASLLALLRKSPIGAQHGAALKGLTLGGRGDFGFSMVLPLHHAGELELAGKANLHGADVANADWGLQLGKLAGELDFDAHGFSGSQLAATFRGAPAKLDIAVGRATGDPARQVGAKLNGHFDVAQLLEGRDALKPLLDFASGSADFTIGFDLASAASAEPGQMLSIDSDLRGVALDLPAPLHKLADTTLPMHLQLGLPTAGSTLRLALGDVVQARARLPQDAGQKLAAHVLLGATAPSDVPAGGIVVGGSTAMLDVSGWARYAMAASKGVGGNPMTVDVQAAAASVFGKRFQAMRLKLQPGPQQTVLSVDGAQVRGSLELPAAELDRRGIVARFDRLYWPGEPPPAPGTTTPAPAASVAAPAPAATADAAAGIAPASLPPLHLWVADLRFGDAKLGDARFESWPTAQGMHIDQLRTRSDSVHIGASGDWNGSAQASRTHMVIDFGAQSLGRMLDAFGFDGLFTGGQTDAHLDASWPGAPFAFALARADGTLKVDIGKGRIPEVRPGVGRLFGLISVAELPRRLSLDFGDVFGKGFGFDSIKGDFRLADGNAWTDNLAVKGSAADISVKGRTGMRARDYDQQVLVVPHLGNSLPVVGAVVAGPVGAAAGLAVQGLLGKGLNKAASARYRISGSWDKPDIVLIEKKTVPLPPPAAPAPATSAGSAVPASAASR